MYIKLTWHLPAGRVGSEIFDENETRSGQIRGGRSLWCIWLRWRATGEWDTWWGDNAAVSMQRVLLLNVNIKGPHWSLLSRTRCPENEGTDSRHSQTERARAPPFLPLFVLVEQRGGDARRSRLWNATSPDPSCTVRIVPTCPACTTEVSRREARKRGGSWYGGGRREGERKKREWEERNRFIASLDGRGSSRSPAQSIRERKNHNFAQTPIITIDVFRL